jgi:ABC transporter transmembrane region/Peptidase C39 family
MSAGREAHHGYGEKNETTDGTTAGESVSDRSGTEERIRAPPPAGGEGEGLGALPAPSGVICLCVIAGRHQRSADPVQLTRALGFDPSSRVTDSQLLLAAKELGLKARSARSTWDALPRRALPVVAELKTGEFVVLLRSDPDGQLLVGDPRKPRPERMDRERFQAIWSGRIVLVKSRLRLENPSRPFDLFWFVPAIWKYRRILGEILAASFVIQLFGLATPLFTQVVIDKVLVHKSIPTLDVLAAGMLILILFEAVLSILKTHLMVHTTNRIDVALGARLFRHLLHIPLRYFELRRVGDTVARVRELENIRSFLTGSSINVVLDLVFTVLFVAVMLLYSGVLTLVTLASIPLFVVLSLVMRPLLRERLGEKFDRGAENQSYLVEAVTGVQTVKAMALEPVFYRRWEVQLARYVTASLPHLAPLRYRQRAGSELPEALNPLDPLGGGIPRDARPAYGRAAHCLSDALGESSLTDPAHGAALAGLPASRYLDRPPGRSDQYPGGARSEPGEDEPADHPRCRAARECPLPLPVRRAGDPEEPLL